jgi:hypothetical protein
MRTSCFLGWFILRSWEWRQYASTLLHEITSLETVHFKYKTVCFSSPHQLTHLKLYVNSWSHSEITYWFMHSWIRRSVYQWPIHVIHAFARSLSFIQSLCHRLIPLFIYFVSVSLTAKLKPGIASTVTFDSESLYNGFWEPDHSPPTNAEVKKMWIYTSTPPYSFMA